MNPKVCRATQHKEQGYRYVNVADSIADGLETVLTDDIAHNRNVIRDRFEAALLSMTPTTTLESMRLTLQRLACRN